MLTRRHIRVKVLQSIYAYNQTENKDLEKQESDGTFELLTKKEGALRRKELAKLRKYLKLDDKVEILNIHGEGFRLVVNTEA